VKNLLLSCLLALFTLPTAFAQEARELNAPLPTAPARAWKGQWITHPGLVGSEHAVVLFRRTVDFPAVPASCIVHVSADNHYTLFVNGKRVCHGPQLSDIRHWRYETVDLAPFLKPGKNVVAMEVVNFGPNRFFGMQSIHTALLVNAFSPEAAVLNTSGNGSWKTTLNRGLRGKEVRWRTTNNDISGGFYAAQPTDSLLTDRYLWGWEKPEFDDTGWVSARFFENASAFGGGFVWLLEPRNVPLQAERPERLARVARSAGITVPDAFLRGSAPITIPPRTTARFLIDHGVLTMGFPELSFSGGRGASCTITYAENLFNPDKTKGNRNDLDGKQILGYKDVVLPDGSPNRTYRPTWLRTFRFVQFDVTTADEPLVLRDFLNQLSTSPVPLRAAFRASDSRYNQVFDICWRTANLCTQDYFLSDAYYETMQYLGDSKVHILTWQALTGNDLHVRNALKQFDDSRLPDGNLTSCYPLKSTFVHPTYSMIWVDMLYDYLRQRGDDGFVKAFLPNIRHTLDGLTVLLDSTGLPGRTRWDYFNDWYEEGKGGGLAPGSKEGHSAIVALHYVHALQNAGNIYEFFGKPADAAEFRRRAAELQRRAKAHFFDPKTGLFVENETRFADQRPNLMAVLTNTIPPAQQRAALEKVAADTSLSQAGYYYRFYFFDALRHAKAGHLFGAALQPWLEAVANGLSTTPEHPDMSRRVRRTPRSECHPWSTAPAWAFYSVIAGIEPGGIGFRTVRLEPNLGELREVEGSYPHPKGDIRFRFEKTPAGLRGTVTLPPGLTGTLHLGTRTVALKPGTTTLP